MRKLNDLRRYVLPVQLFALITLPLVAVVLWTILVAGLFSIVTNATFTQISSSEVMWTANCFFYVMFAIGFGDMMWGERR